MGFVCPLCGEALARTPDGRSAACPHGHCFDYAKEGYLNLLQANHKHSASPGDSRDMVAARRRFLQAEYYAPFQQALAALALSLLPQQRPVVVDAGCGEGSYTAQLLQRLHAAGKVPRVYGCDISKEAVRLAAKAAPGARFAVASSFALPLGKACADLLIAVFAPVAPQEFARVLKPGAAFVLAAPGPRHLFGLKEILYDAPYENPAHREAYPGFALERCVPVRAALTLRGAAVQDLCAMTPYFWKTPRAGLQRLQAVSSLQTEVAFDYLLYRRTPKRA